MGYQVTPSDPPVEIDIEGMKRRMAAALKARNITTDAQYDAAIGVLFNSTNASGLTANTRTLLTEFFRQFFKIG